MSAAERIDLLLHQFFSGFFSIPARQPASGIITFAQMRVLWTLDRSGSATPGQIADRLGVTSSTSTGLVERLARGGYIHRTHSKEDRRQVLLTLKPKGRRLMAGFSKLRRSRLQKLMTRLERPDVRRMAEALETLNRIVGRWKEAR